MFKLVMFFSKKKKKKARDVSLGNSVVFGATG